MARRAIGIVRVSQTAGREGESFRSPSEQRDRIAEACGRDALELVETHEELDVSGGTPLADRPGLSVAVEAVEEGRADVVMVAYFDRLVRSLRVQDEVVSRVEAAGGRVVALDFGDITGATAAQWLSGTMIGAVSEYYRRSAKERNRASQVRAVADGIAPISSIPAGYVKGPDKRLLPDPATAPAVAEAFNLRAGGSTIKDTRAYLASMGIERSFHGVQHMLTSKYYLGEIHFGDLVNLEAHEPLVDRSTWLAVQRVGKERGTRPKSQRLLARLGVLRCGTCNARMTVGTAGRDGTYPFYRCNPLGDCPRRVTVSAVAAEEAVVARVREILADAEGRASAEERHRKAEATLTHAQEELDAALRMLADFSDEAGAVDRLNELRRVRDEAQAHLDKLGGSSSAVVVRADADWDLFTLAEKRALIKATIKRVSVAPGRRRGNRSIIADRLTIEAFGEDASSG